MPKIPDGWVSEEQLATELNVARELLRAMRPTLSEADFTLCGNTVAWKKTAATAVALSLGLTWPTLPDEDPTAKKPAPQPELLTVSSEPRAGGHHFPNPRIIRARRANGAEVEVSVMDSSKYVTRGRDGQPMTFLAAPSTNGPHWCLVGREPRYPGQF